MNVLFTSLSVLSQHAGRYLHLSQQTPVVFQGLPSHAFISLVSHSAAATAVKSIEFLTAHENSSGGGVGALEWLAAQQLQQRTYPLPMFDDSENPDSQQQLQYADVAAMCSTGQLEVNISSLAAAAQEVLRVYMEHEQTLSSSAAATALTRGLYSDSQWATYSCVLYDDYAQRLWLISDAIGATPLWFGFTAVTTITSKHDTNLIAGTDLFLCYHAAGSSAADISAIGPGQLMAIDLATHEILESVHGPSVGELYADDLMYYSHDDPYFLHLQLQAATVRAVSAVVSASSTCSLVTDPLDAGSILLERIVIEFSMKCQRIETTPLVVVSSVTDTLFHALLEGLDDILTQQSGGPYVRQPGLRMIASDIWTKCSSIVSDAIADHSTDEILRERLLMSALNSLQSLSPQAQYMRNLFCRLFGIRIVYPFASPRVQSIIRTVNYAHSFFQTAATVKSDLLSHILMKSTRSFSLNGNTFTSNSPNIDTTEPGRWIDIPLLQVVELHSNADGIFALVVATDGYKEMLSNFLSSVAAIDSRNVLVLTMHDSICRIADYFKAGCIMTGDNDTESSVEFGTVAYQRLMLQRTEYAMQLLLLGFQPIIADIDTVWLDDPFVQLPLSFMRNSLKSSSGPQTEGYELRCHVTYGEAPLPGIETNNRCKRLPPSADVKYDIAITDDFGAVCGCFVALSFTANAILFWKTVLSLHTAIVQQASENGKLAESADSEQKILNDLIFSAQYEHSLNIYLLPHAAFPAGRTYFNIGIGRIGKIKNGELNSTMISRPVVIHNNHLVGKNNKKERFIRYELWNSSRIDKALAHASTGGNADTIDPQNIWKHFFAEWHKDVSIPSIHLYTALHSSVISKLDFACMFSIEGLPEHRGHGSIILSTTNDTIEATSSGDIKRESTAVGEEQSMFPDSIIVVATDPPTVWDFYSARVAQLNLAAGFVGEIYTATVLLRPRFAVELTLSLDVGINRSHFGVDRINSLPCTAHETVLWNQLLRRMENNNSRSPYASLHRSNDSNSPEEVATEAGQNLKLQYVVKVLAHNRPAHLQRLLDSLMNAQYPQEEVISMDIIVDAPRPNNDEDASLVAEVIEIAKNFPWEHGALKIIMRNNYTGRSLLYITAWEPSSNDEIALFFEDSVEVSPLYFQWVVSAANKYYAADHMQRSFHERLYKSARGDDFNSSLRNFTIDAAGIPLLYGICLQKQHLEAKHYPKHLHVRNGYRPYLYSLAGAWGMLHFPRTWKVFREWIERHANVKRYSLFVENMFTNTWLRHHQEMWLPLHIRFAYETGLKCLYPNLPGNYSFLKQHVADDASDDEKLGTYGIELISTSDSSIIGNDVQYPENGASLKRLVQWSLNELPSITELARWQYDFNMRRAGAFGPEATVYPSLGSHHKKWSSDEQQQSCEYLQHRHVMNEMRSIANGGSQELSEFHWMYLKDILDHHLVPYSPIIHLVGRTQQADTSIGMKLQLLLSYHYFNQSMITTDDATLRSLQESIRNLPNIAADDTEDSMKVGISTVMLALLTDTHIDFDPALLVIDMQQDYSLGNFNGSSCIACADEQQHILSRNLFVNEPMDYVLVINRYVCAAAPTDIALLFRGDSQVDRGDMLVSYSVVEEVCTLLRDEVHDGGGVLYRRSSIEQEAGILTGHRKLSRERYAISKQVDGGLVHRRTVIVDEDSGGRFGL